MDASIDECRWSFAASDENIDAVNGEMKSRIVSWQCESPLAKDTQVDELLEALAGDQPLGMLCLTQRERHAPSRPAGCAA